MSKLYTSLAMATAGALLAWPCVSYADGSMSAEPGRSTGINPEPPRGPAGPLPTGTTSTPYDDTPDTNPIMPAPALPPAPIQKAPPAPPARPAVPTSTTTTTSAEYYENVGAERPKWTPNKPLLVVGSALFVGSYGASVIVGAASGNDADKKLYIPVVGPWLDMGQRSCGFGQCGAGEDVNNGLLVASGIAQATGLGLVVASLIAGGRGEERVARQAPKSELHVMPTSLGRGAPGVGAFGTF